jgi:hypothetical protein
LLSYRSAIKWLTKSKRSKTTLRGSSSRLLLPRDGVVEEKERELEKQQYRK